MSKFKKVLSVVLVIAMVAAISIAGTMAYLTDNDSQINTFTNGNVKIDLWEDFGDNDEEGIEHLLPTTGKNEDGSQINGVNKEVYVTNTGSEDAYVRVHIAIPAILDDATDASQNILHFNYNAENAGKGLWDWSKTTGEYYTGDWNVYTATIDDIDYNVYVVTYESALAPGETTVDAIWQVYMDSSVTNEQIAEINETLGSEWKILVAAEAGQAGGYDDAYTALNTQFGIPGQYKIKIADWDLREDVVFAEKYPVINNADDLKAALTNGGNYIFGADVITDGAALTAADGVTVNLDMKGYTLNGAIIVPDTASLTVGNGTIVNKNSGVSCIESYGSLVLNDVTATSARHVIKIESGTVEINGGTYATSDFGATDKVKMTANTLYVKAGTAIVNGGTFTGPRGSKYDSGTTLCVQENATVTVNDGNFSKGLNNTLSNKGTLTVKGGTYDQDPSAYVAVGYTATNSNGTYTVVAE